jgi:hypothetical protein
MSGLVLPRGVPAGALKMAYHLGVEVPVRFSDICWEGLSCLALNAPT